MVEGGPVLTDLWRRRASLTAAELGRLFQLVCDALGPCNPRELRALGDEKAEYVAQFLHLKVLRLESSVDRQDDGHSAPSSAAALCAYFRRYLIDCTRAASFRLGLSTTDEAVVAELERVTHEAHDADMGSVLREHALDELQVRASARGLIGELGEPERLLLIEAFCGEAAGGMAGVASRHRIASYHYRAGKLGIVIRRDALPADYAKTTIGSWLEKSLGIRINSENLAAIRAAFNILCSETSFLEGSTETPRS